MSADCLFCKIIAGTILSKRFYEDEHVIAITDVNPQAEVHLLVMPRHHYANITEFADGAEHAVIAQLMSVAAGLGKKHGPGGFRLVINTGSDGGQTVDHLHVHVLAGRHMNWPPG